MSNVIRMVPWLLIAITAASVVFQESAVLLLATALIGLILWTVALFKINEKNVSAMALGMAASAMGGLLLSQQMQRLMKHTGLPEQDISSPELESMLKKLQEKAGPTPPDMTA